MRGLPAVLVICLALSGCARSAGGSDEAETLNEILWDRSGTRTENQARLDERARQREERIALCMAAEGWEYTPVDYSQFRGPLPDIPEDPDEFRETFGYGITTIEWPDAEPFVDPNEAYVSGLSEADRSAYFDALNGTADLSNPQNDEDTGEEWFALVGGCHNEAWNQTGVQAVWDELGPELDELHQRMESDPRMVDATTQWSGCMAEAGYSFARLNEPFEYLIEKQNDLWASEPDPFEGMTEEEIQEFTQTASEDERQAADSGPDEAAMAGLRAEEMAIAAADRECRKQHVGGLEEKVQRELEAQFIAEQPELLEKARELLGGD